jgi:hypothetical protein
VCFIFKIFKLINLIVNVFVNVEFYSRFSCVIVFCFDRAMFLDVSECYFFYKLLIIFCCFFSGKFLKHVTFIDRPGYMLHKIADHALWAKDRVDSEKVKGMWCEGALASTNELHILRNSSYSQPIDMRGFADYSIFQHLEYHSSLEVVSNCLCGTFYHKDYYFIIRQLEQIELLGNPQRLNEAKMPYCLKCNRLRTLLELNPMHNWLVVFRCFLNPKSPKLQDIPKILTFGSDLFKLEYLAYTQESSPTMKHEISLQFIRHTWYVFDSGKSPKFFRWHLDSYNYRNAFLTHIVYFKC